MLSKLPAVVKRFSYIEKSSLIRVLKPRKYHFCRFLLIGGKEMNLVIIVKMLDCFESNFLLEVEEGRISTVFLP